MLKEVKLHIDGLNLLGHLNYIANNRGWIIFVHGSGSSHKSKRNNWVAGELNKQGFGTLLFDLLTVEEDQVYLNRFDIPLLARRLKGATEWLLNRAEYHGEPIAYFGASTGAAAALLTAGQAEESWQLCAIVSRGGRPDLVRPEILHEILIPTLLIVGGHDSEVIELNEMAQKELTNSKLVIVPAATHLFEESGALSEVVRLSAIWFTQQMDQRRNYDLSG